MAVRAGLVKFDWGVPIPPRDPIEYAKRRQEAEAMMNRINQKRILEESQEANWFFVNEKNRQNSPEIGIAPRLNIPSPLFSQSGISATASFVPKDFFFPKSRMNRNMSFDSDIGSSSFIDSVPETPKIGSKRSQCKENISPDLGFESAPRCSGGGIAKRSKNIFSQNNEDSLDSGIGSPPNNLYSLKSQISTRPDATESRIGESNKEKTPSTSFPQELRSRKQATYKDTTPKRQSAANSKEIDNTSGNSKRTWEEELLWLQSCRDIGLWIECCYPNCRKWRFTDDYHDPIDVPEEWFCHMNTQERFSSCDLPQQNMDLPATIYDVVECDYNAGSIVWARIVGFPWWPAIIDDCPYLLRYYQLPNPSSNVPNKYNVTFINDAKIEHAWIGVKNLKPYKKNPKNTLVKRTKYRGVDYESQLNEACVLADQAIPLSITERLRKFSLISRLQASQNKISQPHVPQKPPQPTQFRAHGSHSPQVWPQATQAPRKKQKNITLIEID